MTFCLSDWLTAKLHWLVKQPDPVVRQCSERQMTVQAEITQSIKRATP